MAKDVKFNIKLQIDGKEHVVSASTDVRNLAKNFANTQQEVNKFRDQMISLSGVTTVLNNLRSSMDSIIGSLKGLTDAYAVQEQAETQLTTVMRERMNASDAEIQSIKDLASAQQELGVIGDEVQLAGAQQVSTFLEQKASLETLLPAMNDLLAQQKGLNATSSDAVNIGNLMGKAMQGQTSALKRVGITFDDAQEKVMKFGTEQERASMLAEIITQNVGHMNAELANTAAGGAKQMANSLGDLAEQAGKVVMPYMPILQLASSTTVAASGVMSVVKSLGALNPISRATSLILAATTGSFTKNAAAARVFSAALRGAAFQTTALKLALRGLMVATGVGAAIAGLSVILEHLFNSGKKAEDAIKDIGETSEKTADKVKEAYDNTYSTTLDGLREKFGQLKAEWTQLKTKGEKTRWIKENRDAFDELRIKVNDVSDAESLFSGKTDAVVEAFNRRAKAAARLSQLTELYRQQIELADQKQRVEQTIATDAAKNGRNAKKGDLIADSSYRSERYGSVDRDGQWHFSEAGAALYSGTNAGNNPQIKAITAKQEKIEGQIKILNDEISKDGKEYYIPKNNTSSTRNTPHVPNKTTKEPSGLIGKLETELKTLREQLAEAKDEATIETINKSIELKENEISRLQKLGKEASDKVKDGAKKNPVELVFKADASNLKDINTNISILQDQLENASITEAAGINREISLWQKKADAIRNAGKAVEEQKAQAISLSEAWSGIKNVGDSIRNINDALEGNKDAWSTITTIVDSAIQMYNGLSTVIGFIQTLTTANEVLTGTEIAKGAATIASNTATTATETVSQLANAAEVTTIATNKSLTQSFMQLAAARYMAAHADIPFAGFAIGSGYTAAATALVQAVGVMPFAKGGVVSGPTMALVGEYSGAVNNPEVIAPLDKLRSLIDTDSQGGGTVNFKIEGRALVGILNKESNIRRRS